MWPTEIQDPVRLPSLSGPAFNKADRESASAPQVTRQGGLALCLSIPSEWPQCDGLSPQKDRRCP